MEVSNGANGKSASDYDLVVIGSGPGWPKGGNRGGVPEQKGWPSSSEISCLAARACIRERFRARPYVRLSRT